jgi:hypothetical protein
MLIIITDIDSGEEETSTLKAPRKEQYLSDEEIRGRREFAINAVILEGLKFIANRDTSPRFIASPNSNRVLHGALSESETQIQDIDCPLSHPRVLPMCPCSIELILPRILAFYHNQTHED